MTAILNQTAGSYAGNSRNIEGVRHSYSETPKRFETPSGTNKVIQYGDRLFARFVMQGGTVIEFMIDRVNDFTELLGELRLRTRGLYGLGNIWVRNMSRGWCMERPLMLYPDKPAAKKERQMLFPWETH